MAKQTAIVRDTRRLADTLIFGPSSWLLASILLWVVLDPLLRDTHTGPAISDGLITILVLVAAHAASAAHDVRASAFTMAVLAVAAVWADHALSTPATTILECVALALLFGFVVVELLLFLLHGGITAGRLQAAIAAYLLTAFVWALLYGIVAILRADAFTVAMLDGEGRIELSTLLYFSVATISSTGYGDIAPVDGVARALAIVEQIAGLAFVAVLIARLAGTIAPPAKAP